MANLPEAGDKKLDARIVKTLASIKQAFLTLLEQKDYNDITVQDILSHAIINRTTFYKYFDNKDDLARHMVNTIKSDFLAPIIDSRMNTPWEEMSKEAEIMMNNNHHTLQLLWRIETTDVNLKQDTFELIRQKYSTTIKKEDPAIDAEALGFQSHVYASLVISLIDYSVQDGRQPEPDCKRKNLLQVFERIVK